MLSLTVIAIIVWRGAQGWGGMTRARDEYGGIVPKSRVRKRKNGRRVNQPTLQASDSEATSNQEFMEALARATLAADGGIAPRSPRPFDRAAHELLTGRGWELLDAGIGPFMWEWLASKREEDGIEPTTVFPNEDGGGYTVEFAGPILVSDPGHREAEQIPDLAGLERRLAELEEYRAPDLADLPPTSE